MFNLIAGLILILNFNTSEMEDLQENLKRHTRFLSSDIGERNFSQHQNLEQAGSYIFNEFESYGYSVKEQIYYLERRPFRNIIATKEGKRLPKEGSEKVFFNADFRKSNADSRRFSDETICENPRAICENPRSERVFQISPKKIIVVGAHYDSVIGSKGADDNASGVAALLELARLLSKESLNKTLKFIAFTNEEPPLFMSDDMGSMRYVKEARKGLEDIEAMLCLESVGYYSNQKNSQGYPFGMGVFYPDTGNFIAFCSNIKSKSLLDKVVKEFRRNSNLPSEYLVAPIFLAPAISFSDNSSFWKYGYKAIMVTDTAFYRNPYYHTQGDTFEKLNYESMAGLVKGLYGVVIKLCE